MKLTKKMAVTKSPYYKWETYKNGMYKTYSEIDNYSELFIKSKSLLSDQALFFDTGMQLICTWNISCSNFLNNSHINKIAFIGQASCCYKYQVPEIVTKDVWKTLDMITQNNAKNTAKLIIKEYEKRHKRIYSKMAELWI